MRHGELVATCTGGTEEEPTREALVDFVLGVAASRLHGLEELSLNVAESEVLKLPAKAELLLGKGDGSTVSVARDLGVDAVEALARSHEGGDADDGLEAEHANLHLRAVSEGVGHGCHAGF